MLIMGTVPAAADAHDAHWFVLAADAHDALCFVGAADAHNAHLPFLVLHPAAGRPSLCPAVKPLVF